MDVVWQSAMVISKTELAEEVATVTDDGLIDWKVLARVIANASETEETLSSAVGDMTNPREFDIHYAQTPWWRSHNTCRWHSIVSCRCDFHCAQHERCMSCFIICCTHMRHSEQWLTQGCSDFDIAVWESHSDIWLASFTTNGNQALFIRRRVDMCCRSMRCPHSSHWFCLFEFRSHESIRCVCEGHQSHALDISAVGMAVWWESESALVDLHTREW